MPRWLLLVFSALIILTACAPATSGVPAGYEDNTSLIESLEQNGFIYEEMECENPCRGYINRDLKLGAIAYKNGSGMLVMPLEDENAVAVAFLIMSDIYGVEVFDWARDRLDATATDTQTTTLNGYYLILSLEAENKDDIDDYHLVFVAQPAK